VPIRKLKSLTGVVKLSSGVPNCKRLKRKIKEPIWEMNLTVVAIKRGEKI